MIGSQHLELYGVPQSFIRETLAPGAVVAQDNMNHAMTALVRPSFAPIVEWAEGTIKMPAGQGYKSGDLRLLKYQKGIVASWQEEGVERIFNQKVPRTGSSLCSAVGVAHTTCHEAEDAIYYERSKDEAQTFHDDVLYPLLVSSPDLKKLLRPEHMDKWYDRYLLNGAAIHLRSASKDGSFRAIKGKAIFCDEVSSKEWLAKGKGTFGDKTDRAFKRAQQFGDGRMYCGSSPGDASTCIISKGYAQSDKRVFRMPCPHCQHVQEFEPNMQPGEGAGMYFNLDSNGEYATWSDPKTGIVVPDIWYQCRGPKECRIREIEKARMVDDGDWYATAMAARKGYVGFYIWSAYSLDPRSTWRHIADEYRQSLIVPAKRRTFANEWLGQAYDEDNARPVEGHWLKRQRTFNYPAPAPDPVECITVGFDNQTVGAKTAEKRERTGKIARSEFTVIGWGKGEEAYVLRHGIIPLPPFSPESNAAKLAIMDEAYEFADGTYMMPQGGFDDVGDGNTMNVAVNFVSSKEAQERGLWGVRGKGEAKGNRTQTIKGGQMVIHNWNVDQIGTAAAKDDLFARLNIEGWGPMAIHFPSSFDKSYFDSLTATTLKEFDDGSGKTYWEDKKGNEALDCFVYAYARMLMLRKNEPWLNEALAPPADQTRYFGSVIQPLIDWDQAKKPDRSFQSPSWQSEMKGKRQGGTPLVVQRVRPRKASAPPPPPRVQTSPLPQAPGLPVQQPKVQRTPFAPRQAQADAADDMPRYGRIGSAPKMGWR